jgi:hypothetical protein
MIDNRRGIATAWHLSAVVALLVTLLLPACNAAPRLDAGLTPTALAKSNNAVVILVGTFSGETCGPYTMQLGQRVGDKLQPVKSFTFLNGETSGKNYPAVELPAGEYHVLELSCHPGPSLGRERYGYQTGPYEVSFASFKVAAGEVVNLGSLVAVNVMQGAPYLKVVPIPSSALEPFARASPTVAAALVSRPMTLDPAWQKPNMDLCKRLLFGLSPWSYGCPEVPRNGLFAPTATNAAGRETAAKDAKKTGVIRR